MLQVNAQKRIVPHPIAGKKAAVSFTGTPEELDRLLGKLEVASIFDRSLKTDIDFVAITRVRSELRTI